MQELGETIRYELELQDIPCTVHTDGFPEPRPGLVYALLAPREFVALEGEEALPGDSILKRTVFICADPPGEPLDDATEALMWRAGAIFDIDVRSLGRLHRAGIPARSLRPGYSALRDRFDPSAPRPIDVIFLGTASSRRTRLLHRCAGVFARHNCLLQLADPSERNAGGSTSFLAAEKYDLLARARVVVNLHRDAEPYLEWLRMLEAMHSGAVFVTEHASGLAPFVAGEHLLVASEQSLPYVVEAVLRSPELAARLRDAAYERLKSWLPFAMSIGVLRAALVELVGRPVPDKTPTGRPIGSGSRASESRESPPIAAGQDAQRLAWELSRSRTELVRLRRTVAALRLGSALQAATVDQVETPAWRARRAPEVSALIVIDEAPDSVEATLDSLAASRTRDLEAVVACGSAETKAARLVASWLQAHPQIPARALFGRADGGLGAARNAALELARAPSCLVLEGGEELYPRCLEVLAGTLAAVDAVLVYPIVQVSGAVETYVALGGEPLLGYLGWEPGRLRPRSVAASPFLISAPALRSVGGFTEDPRLDGWVDYDLQCSLADRGWSGQLVPQILARRRASSLPGADAAHGYGDYEPVAALVERHPALLRG